MGFTRWKFKPWTKPFTTGKETWHLSFGRRSFGHVPIICIHFPPLQIISNLGVNKNTRRKTNMLEGKNELFGRWLFPFQFRVIFRFHPLVFRGINRSASSDQGAKKWRSEKECKPPSPEGSRLGPLHGWRNIPFHKHTTSGVEGIWTSTKPTKKNNYFTSSDPHHDISKQPR